ncbi:MAG: glycosyltransferase family 4 protein [Armatimonadetes bacterium]|nr:glycosyltransferase family 4 protein [Armatimonadota bacterium]
MKVLYAIARSVPGGAQTNVMDLIGHLGNELEPGLVTFEPGFLTDRARAMNVPTWVVPAPTNSITPLRDLSALRSILRVIREFKPDLVHAHSTKSGIIARVAARIAGVPSVFTAHGWAFTEGVSERRRKIAIAVERMVAPLAARIICVSNYDRELALRCGVGNPDQIVVIPNGIEASDLSSSYTQRDNVRCVMVGRFSPSKDQPALIRAVSKVEEIELLLVGDGELIEESKSLAFDLGIRDRVRFLGSRNDVPQILADCDIFALVSRWEGLPYAILEAMRAGLPVVASDVGGVSEAVVDGETGYLVPRGDVNSLSERLRYLARHPEERRRLGESGRHRCLTHFTLSKMVESTLAVYREVVG